MSQSAENQSAIIENENNSNIVMESQAAVSEDRAEIAADEAGDQLGETLVQDEESMDIGEGGDALAADAEPTDFEPVAVGAAGDAGFGPTEGGEESGDVGQGDADDLQFQDDGNGDAAQVESMEVDEIEPPLAEEAKPADGQEVVDEEGLGEAPAELADELSQEDEPEQSEDQVDAGRGEEEPRDVETASATEDLAEPLVEDVAESAAEIQPEEDAEPVEESGSPEEPEAQSEEPEPEEDREAEEEPDQQLESEAAESEPEAVEEPESQVEQGVEESAPVEPEGEEQSMPAEQEEEPEVSEQAGEESEAEEGSKEQEPRTAQTKQDKGEVELTAEDEDRLLADEDGRSQDATSQDAPGVQEAGESLELQEEGSHDGPEAEAVEPVNLEEESSQQPADETEDKETEDVGDTEGAQQMNENDDDIMEEGAEKETAAEAFEDADKLEDTGETDKAEDAGDKLTDDANIGDSSVDEKSQKGMVASDAEAPGDSDSEAMSADVSALTVSLSQSVDKDDSETSASDAPADGDEDKASDATIEERVDHDISFEVTEVKSGEDAESDKKDDEEGAERSSDEPESMETDQTEKDDSHADQEKVKKETEESQDSQEKTSEPGEQANKDSKVKQSNTDDDDDVVVLDDDEDMLSAKDIKKEAMEKGSEGEAANLFNSSNDMGIQIESVSGGADEVHDSADQPIKQENGLERTPGAGIKSEPGTAAPPTKKSATKTQTCIVCKKVGKCKYNIVRNGDIKHLCDDTCFQKFRTNPTMYLKGTIAAPGAKDKTKTTSTPAIPPAGPQLGNKAQGYKTCIVCQLMNINTQGQFCMWKGLDFCGEGCLGKFQSGISTSCTLCTAFIPLTARSANCLRIGNEVRPFCSSRCFNDYKQRMRLCAFCQKDLQGAKDSFSAPVGSEGAFRDFCTQACMKKYEDLLQSDVEIIRVEKGKAQQNTCSVCQKMELSKHTVKYNQKIHHLCSDPCLSAFQYANKLDMSACDQCGTLTTTLESSPHIVQFEGQQKRFCSDNCVNSFRNTNRKISPCAWCGSQKPNFDMIERLDSNNKFQLFCSLNCLSLYRVNLQAKSNQAVTCDQCLKYVPAQYHLTMSDASVRNFCSYNCVMSFQAQFTKGGTAPTPPAPPTPKHKHNTRGRGKERGAGANQPSFPIISNVVSLAPQGGQKVNIKSPSGIPVVVSGAGQTVKTTGVSQAGGQMQQQIIIQPPPPKVVKNKALLCKPFVQTKATSCRPHTQTKETQTDEDKRTPVLIPIPVPIYLPAPMAMYSAPAPTPFFIPIPIPVPCFIPTTRKSASGIMKLIKEIQEKTPSDPLEAEILMMAAAVSADGKNSSDSESEEDILPEVSVRKRHRDVDDDNDADVMPLTSHKGADVSGEEDMIQMALRMAEEMSGPITDLESAVEAMPINTEPPQQPPRESTPEPMIHEEDQRESRSRARGAKRGSSSRRSGPRAPKRPRVMPQQADINTNPMPAEVTHPQLPPVDANYHLKFTYGVNAWRHWVMFKNTQLERASKSMDGRVKLFKTDIMQCTADELNYSLCLFVKEVRKPNGDEYSPDSIYYLCLGIQQYLFENGRIDNIFTDVYFEKFTECLTDLLSKCQPKFNSAGQMVCRIEEEHLWECKQLGAHSPYVLLNTLIYFHTKYFMLKTPEDHMKLSFAHILKYWKKGQPGKGGQPTRTVSLRYYSVSTAKKDGSAPTSTTKKGSKDGIPVYEVTENGDNPLRCPVKLYEFYLSKCPESIKNRSDIFYPVPERSCVPDSPVWYSTSPIGIDTMTKMLTRILLVREIQEAHLHAQPIYV